ncbi:MAG: sigma 54-interacting transcriptional regulator [Firmicutes bacterium]|nr:sigma 54-interacting transcriptional regulator [Bacillota bacterium]
MFSLTEKKESLRKAWDLFISTGEISSNIRPIIANSWVRCRKMSINPYLKVEEKVSQAKLQDEIEKHRNLLEVSLPIIKNLYDFVQGSGFLISLATEKGIVIEIRGDTEILKKSKLCRGNILTENSVGTNSIGLCLINKKPVQVFAAEHFRKSFHEWTCSSAPIFDENKNLLGILNMNGDYEKVHLHTLGMVVGGAKAIENSLLMQKSYNEVAVSNTLKTAIMESIDEGLIVLNKDRSITHINDRAKKILKIAEPKEKALYRKISELLGVEHPLIAEIDNCFKKVNYENIFLEEDYTVTFKLINPRDESPIGLILVLKETKKMKKIVNRFVGARAMYTFNDLIGNNESFLSAVNMAKFASQSDSNVLLIGESGTGKEIFAQAIHNFSKRKDGPFLAINCGGLPRNLVESELFGYAEGAFTGAQKGGNPGKFELADGGTLFLDEIGEMPLEFQVLLLRVLQERAIMRIGGKKLIPVDVRIIAATNKNLKDEVKSGNFRKDLYYRLNVLTISIPPLRERPDDIPLLAEHLLNKLKKGLNKNVKKIDHEVIDAFRNYNWPGNIRELQNVLERALNLSTTENIHISSIPDSIAGCKKELKNISPLNVYEKQLITSLLKENHGNKTRVAQILGISRTTLYKKLKQYY